MDNWNQTNNNDITLEKYGVFKGVITRVDYDYEDETSIKLGHYHIQVTSGDTMASFYITKDTFYMDCNYNVGDAVFGYYRADRPLIMIYPPRYDIVVFGHDNKERSVKVDHFNEELVSQDGTLKLNITPLTWIAGVDGKAYCDKITNKDLIVVYSSSTMSIPALVSPTVVIVMSDK